LLLAQLSGRPLLPMAFAASRAWLFGWDRFVLPWPFSPIAIAVGPPVAVPRDLALGDEAVSGALQRQMEQALHAQFLLAREALR
jgi:lysophospholipid acyltransferase (LPLAT)-like uncharacterized protein